LWVFFALGVLTAIEIWVATALTGGLKAWSLVTLASAKAGCVAIFFMHLKSERNWLRIIALFPAAAGLYAIVLIKEVMFR
jgi:caa(3)-type oxidase subunit IV